MSELNKKINIHPLIPLIMALLLSFSTAGDELNKYLKNISADSLGHVLLVNKAEQFLLVLSSNAPGTIQVIDTFRITTGRVDGNKEKEGDLKTPEGIYEIVALIPGTQLPPKYGPMAFVLDYPNFIDRIQNHIGSNIWIHGRDEEIVDRQTEGCISLENGRLLELSNYIRLRNTPVIIIDSLVHNGHDSQSSKFSLSDSLFIHWIHSWESGDMETFAKLISPNFKTKSWRNRDSYLQNKKNLENIYNWKRVAVDNVQMLQSDYETRIRFMQNYLCPTFFSRGKKELNLIWADSVWQIVAEDFTATEPRSYVLPSINSFLKTWKTAWETGNIDQYIAFYDSSFTNTKYNSFTAWQTYKKDVLAKSRDIQIGISDLSVSSSIPCQWIVSFRQDYTASSYHDQGIKTLIVTGHPTKPGNFKILSEEWEVSN